MKRAILPRRILVLSGGWSAERAVSRKTGRAVERALSASGFTVSRLDPAHPGFLGNLLVRRGRVDVVFNALHGAGGEDGVIQGFLEVVGLPYTGSGVLASAMAMDKCRAKELFALHGIPSPLHQMAVRVEGFRLKMKCPVVVKPANGGSTIGVTIVPQERQLPAALTRAWKHDERALVEEFIPGQELTVGVVAGRPLPVIEIRPRASFYDYRAKYTAGGSRHLIPPLVPLQVQVEAQRLAVRAHRILGCEGATRTDLRYHDRKRALYVLEINTMPGCTELSLLPEAAKAAGISMPALVKGLVDEAWAHRGKRRIRPGGRL